MNIPDNEKKQPKSSVLESLGERCWKCDRYPNYERTLGLCENCYSDAKEAARTVGYILWLIPGIWLSRLIAGNQNEVPPVLVWSFVIIIGVLIAMILGMVWYGVRLGIMWLWEEALSPVWGWVAAFARLARKIVRYATDDTD